MHCCDAIRLPGQPQSVNFLLLYCSEAEVFFLYHKSYSLFWWTKNLDCFGVFFLLLTWVRKKKKKKGEEVLNGACGTCCSWTQVYNATCWSPQHLLYCCEVNWFIAENSPLLQVKVFQSCPLGKGIFVKGNLYKWEMCSLFKFKRAPSLSLQQWVPSTHPYVSLILSHTYKHICTHAHTYTAHFQYSHSFYSPNSGCEMTRYFNQLYLICTPVEDRATCVLLLPCLALSMPTGWLWAALDCHACQSLWPTRPVRLHSIPP